MSNETKPDSDEALADEWAAALNGQGDNEASVVPEASTATFDELTDESTGGAVNMDAILDVPVTISMEIGRTKINIRNLLQLNQGSVVELDRMAGEPLDVLVNGT